MAGNRFIISDDQSSDDIQQTTGENRFLIGNPAAQGLATEKKKVDEKEEDVSISDYAKSFASGAVKATGYGARGVGEMFREGGNLVVEGINSLGGDLAPATNPLDGIADWVEGGGESIEESMSPKARTATRESMPEGDVFDPATWTAGQKPTVEGYTLNALSVFGQIAPIVATAVATRGQSLKAQLGTSAGTAAVMGGGAAAGEEGERIRQMSEEELASVPLYVESINQGSRPDQAREDTALAAESGAFRATAPVSAITGLLFGGTLSATGQKALGRVVGTSVGARVAAGAAIDAPLEGAQEVAELMAQRGGAGMATGEDRNLTEDSLGEFVMGGIAGGGVGALGGLKGVPEEAPPPVEDVPTDEPLPGTLEKAISVYENGIDFSLEADGSENKADATLDLTLETPEKPYSPYVYDNGVDFTKPDQSSIKAPDLSIETERNADRRVAIDKRLDDQNKETKDIKLPEGFEDSRLKRLPYRKNLENMRDQLVTGGGIAVVPDLDFKPGESDKPGEVPQKRTPSLNPQWFQSVAEIEGATVDQVKSTIDKALRGDKLGVRQSRVISGMLDEIQGERTDSENVAYVKQELDKARKLRKTLPPEVARDYDQFAGEIYEENEYDLEWDGESRSIYELAEEAYELGGDQNQIEGILENSIITDTQAAKQLTKLVGELRGRQESKQGQQTLDGTEEVSGKPEEQAHTEKAQAGSEEEVTPPKKKGYVPPKSKKLTTNEQETGSKSVPERTVLEEEYKEGVTHKGIKERDKVVRWINSLSDEDYNHLSEKYGDYKKLYGGFPKSIITASDAGEQLHTVWKKALDARNKPKESEVIEDIDFNTDLEKAEKEAATHPENPRPEPSDAQKEAGNYKLGHVTLQGLDISIENPKGSTRSGTDKGGKKWSVTMKHTYGYIKGTVGKDKDHIDIFLTDKAEQASTVFIVDQINPSSGKFDEHKVVLGPFDQEEAYAAYLDNYEKGWQGAGAISEMDIDEFKTWLKGDTTKPVLYKENKKGYRPPKATKKSNENIIKFSVDVNGQPVDVTYTEGGIGSAGNHVHFEFHGDATSESGYKSHFIHEKYVEEAGSPQALAEELAKHFSVDREKIRATEERENKRANKKKSVKKKAAKKKDGYRPPKSEKQEAKPEDTNVPEATVLVNDNRGESVYPGDIIETIDGGKRIEILTVTDKQVEYRFVAHGTKGNLKTDIGKKQRTSVAQFARLWHVYPNAQKKPTKSKKEESTYGAKNKVFTKEAADKAREILKNKLSNLNTGIDPEIFQAGIQLAGYHIEAGARKFTDFSKSMIDDLGEAVRPYLKSWYLAVRNWPGVNNSDMDTESAIEQGATTEVEPEESPTSEKSSSLSDALYAAIQSGNSPSNNNELKAFYANYEGIERKNVTSADMKVAQEAYELALVKVAREQSYNGTDQEIFNRLLKMYQSQPNLSGRTSTSVKNQAYSTPAPLAFLASRLAGIDESKKVYEPTAGNGMLVLNAGLDNAFVNELNDDRANNLVSQGFETVTRMDASAGNSVTDKSMDAVIANPPFSPLDSISRVDGYVIKKLDHLIVANALETMKDDGKATLIIGANKLTGVIGGGDRIFYNWLYSHYNVSGHFEVDGKLYSRQGAAWPVVVLSINGRKQADKSLAPETGTIARYDNWEEIYEKYLSIMDAQSAELDGRRSTDIERDGSGRKGNGVQSTARPDGAQTGRSNSGNRSGSRKSTGSRTSTDAKSGTSSKSNRSGSDNGSLGLFDNIDERGGLGEGSNTESTVRRKTVGGESNTKANTSTNPRKPLTPKLEEKDNEFQAVYKPVSKAGADGVLVPVNMRDPLHAAVVDLDKAVGGIDEYVRKELGYDTQEEMQDALMGLQIDSVAAAIYNIKEKGRGVVIADQTGIGKGRQAAAIIRWVIRQGKIPVFVTVKPQLFSDMYGDLRDIGSTDVKPMIMNWEHGVVHNKKTLFKLSADNNKKSLAKMRTEGRLPSDRNALFMTYSQVQNPKSTAKRDALESVVENAVLILDESHNAAGASNTGDFFQSMIQKSSGVTYLSATFAKRPDNLPVYFRTDILDAVDNMSQLVDAVSYGGTPLQAVVSSLLTKAGQMFRRERSFNGVSIETVTDSDNREHHTKLADSVTKGLRAITHADKLFHILQVKHMDKSAKKEGKQMSGAGNKSSAGVDHSQFSSVVHNFVRQLLLGLKADTAADKAIEAIKRNEKPVIALENTMGSFLQSYAEDVGAVFGESMEGYDWRRVLSRALERSRRITIKDAQGNKTTVQINLNDLHPQVRQAVDKAQRLIDNLKVEGVPASPIDWIRYRIEDAGYSVKEITGRKNRIKYHSDGSMTYERMDSSEANDKVETTRQFNSTELDAIILNVAGSTGISLHSSERFQDRRKRHMVVAQAALDINVFMQMLGRVFRTGQVNNPAYTLLNVDIPAEIRPTSVLSKKLASLNANTSSNEKSSTSIESPDIMNKYGDQVVAQFLNDEENREIGLQMGITPPDPESVDTDFALKVTGRMSLFPVETQRRFYTEIELAYRELIEYLDKTGQNELKQAHIDLEAELVTEKVMVRGKKSDSAFGGDAMLGTYSVKRQGKPPTGEEVNQEIAETLDGRDAEEYGEQLFNGFDSDYRTSLKKMEKKVNDTTAQIETALKEEKPEKEITQLRHRLENENKAYATAEQKAESYKNYVTNRYAVGTIMHINIGDEKAIAAVTKIENNTKRDIGLFPYAPSRTTITLAVNNGIRTIRVPISQMVEKIDSGTRPHFTNERVFDEMTNRDSREQRYIVTGNLISAYSGLTGSKPRLVSFTKANGEIDQGIFMPKSFDAETDVKKDVALRTGSDIAGFLSAYKHIDDLQRYGVYTRGGKVRVSIDRQGGYEINVPASNKEGGNIYLDSKITDYSGDFVKEGPRMVARVSDKADAIKALDALSRHVLIYAPESVADSADKWVMTYGSGKDSSSDTENDGRFSLSRQHPTKHKGRTADYITKDVERITKKWQGAPTIQVVQSDKDLPDHLYTQVRSAGAEGETEGVFDARNTTVYLIADRLPNSAVTQRVIFHETLGHYGLRRMFGRGIVPLLQQVANVYGRKGLQEIADRYGLDLSKNRDRLIAAEEKLASIAETGEKPGFIKRLYALIRQWLRDHGFTIQLTDNDIKSLMARVANRVISGRGADNTGANSTAVMKSQAKQMFYSQMTRVLNQKLPGAGMAPAMAKSIEAFARKGDFKQEELEWSGVLDWLADQKGRVTKDQVLEFVRGNEVQINEVVRSDATGESFKPGDELPKELQDLFDERDLNNIDYPELTLRAEDLGYNVELGMDGEVDNITRIGATNEPTKHHEYQLPGGENYRELLLTLPDPRDQYRPAAQKAADFVGLPLEELSIKTLEANDAPQSMIDDFKKWFFPEGKQFRSGHYDEANILAHVRFNERTDADGKRVLFVEEVQSDWHQQGRKQGYADKNEKAKVEADLAKAKESYQVAGRKVVDADIFMGDFGSGNTTFSDKTRQMYGDYQQIHVKNGKVISDFIEPERAQLINDYLAAQKRARELEIKRANFGANVPDAPFKQSWPLLAMKRMIRYAAENGFDRVAWTTGEQQAERYDLSKQINTLHYAKRSDGTYDIKVIKSYGGRPELLASGINENKLDEYVGKDIAKKIIDNQGEPVKFTSYKSLAGLDLKVGGDGMKGFYDKMLPSILNKYVKKWGGKVSETTFFHKLDERGRDFDAHALDITETMRESVVEGQAMFSRRKPGVEEAMRKAGLSTERKSFADRARDYMSQGKEAIKQDMEYAIDLFKEGALDRFHGIKIAEQRNLGNIPAEQSSYVAARLSTGMSSVMRGILLYGAPEWRRGILQRKEGTTGLLDILAPVKEDIDAWAGWMVGKRAERLMSEGKENNFTDEDIENLISLADGREDIFQSVADDFATFKRSVLDVAEQAGLIDGSTRPVWDMADWIPFYRVIEDQAKGPNNKRGLSHQTSGIRSLKGGDSQLNDPIENIIMNFSHLLDASMKNDAIAKAAENFKDTDIMTPVGYDFKPAIVPRSQIKSFLQNNPDFEKWLNSLQVDVTALPDDVFKGLQTMFAMKPPVDKDVVRVMEGGKPRFYRVNDPMLLSALTAVDEMAMGGIMKPLRWFKRLLTSAVTADPAFIARNFLRDTLHAWVINEDHFKVGIDSLRGLTKTISEKGGMIDMMFAGGSFMGGYINANDPTDTAKSVRRALRKQGFNAASTDEFMSTIVDTPAKMWEVWRHFGDSVENANREAVYEAALKAGKSKAQAVFEAKDLMDYSMRGNWAVVKVLTDSLPFFNARLQGLYKLGRAGALPLPKMAKRNIVMRGAMISAASLVLLSLNDDDERYQELPDWDKDTYWHIFTPGGGHYRIPKPFEIGLIYGTYVERAARNIMGDDANKKTFSRFLWGMRDTLAFDPFPQAIRPLAELYANKSNFTGMPIEGMADEGKLPSARYNENTSETTRAVGKVISDPTGLSPKQLEHLIRGYLGALGAYALDASDMAVRSISGMPARPAARIDEIPVIKAFVRASPAYSTVYATDMYEMHREIDQIYRTIRAFQKEGNIKEARALLEEHRQTLRARGVLGSGLKAIKNIRRRIDIIMRDTRLTNQEKREQIDKLLLRRNEITRRVYDRVSSLEAANQ